VRPEASAPFWACVIISNVWFASDFGWGSTAAGILWLALAGLIQLLEKR
jgi:hypothetical protein